MFSDIEQHRSTLDERLGSLEFVSGYPLTDLKFVRKVGPPLSASSLEPPRSSEICVDQLPPDVLEDEIFWLFNKVGDIHDLCLMTTPSGLENRGFCFVRYSKPEDAKEAVKSLNGYEPRPGQKIRVKLSIENNKLSLYGLSPNKSPLEIHQELAVMGIVGIKDVVVHMSYASSYMNGHVFVLFESHDLAATARKAYSQNLVLWNRPLRLNWANISYEIGTSTSNVIKIKNFKPNLRQDHFEEMLDNVIDRNARKEVTVVNGNAHIHFFNHKEAEKSMHKLQLFFYESPYKISWYEVENTFFEHAYSYISDDPIDNQMALTFDWLSLANGSSEYTNGNCPEKPIADIDEPKTFEELCLDSDYLKTLVEPELTFSHGSINNGGRQSKFLDFFKF